MAERKKKARRARNPDLIDWRRSEARCIIIEDLTSGALPIDQKEFSAEEAWENIYKDKVEFLDVPFEQFKARLRDHRSQVKKGLARSQFEENCLSHDRALFPHQPRNTRGELVFDLHPAKNLLQGDVALKKHVGMKPQHLWRTRPEYQEFDLNIFRDHIYQEIRREKFINYMHMKREKKKEVTRCKPPGTYEFRRPHKKQKTDSGK